MQLSNVICDCDATSGHIPGSGTVSCRQHNLSSYCLCSRRELDAACRPLLLLAAADVAAVVINRIVNRKLCLCFVSLLACSPQSLNRRWNGGRCHHHQQHCRRWRFWGEIATWLGLALWLKIIIAVIIHSQLHCHSDTATHKYINKRL